MDGPCRAQAGGTAVEPLKPVGAAAAGDRHVLLPVAEDGQGRPELPRRAEVWRQAAGAFGTGRSRLSAGQEVKSYPRGTAIGIERSEVELYVPRSHRWFGFGDKMHAADEGTAAGRPRRRAERAGSRLMEAARDKTPSPAAPPGRTSDTGLPSRGAPRPRRAAKTTASSRPRNGRKQRLHRRHPRRLWRG